MEYESLQSRYIIKCFDVKLENNSELCLSRIFNCIVSVEYLQPLRDIVKKSVSRIFFLTLILETQSALTTIKSLPFLQKLVSLIVQDSERMQLS